MPSGAAQGAHYPAGAGGDIQAVAPLAKQCMLQGQCGPRSTQIAGYDRNIECGEEVSGVWDKRAFCGKNMKNAGGKELIPR